MGQQRAALPWYALPETRGAQQELWSRVSSTLRAAGVGGLPHGLEEDSDPQDLWRDPQLLLGQACGLDTVLADAPPIRVVAAPQFSFVGCHGATYRSFVVVREDDPARSIEALRGARCAINSRSSHSGMNGLRALVAPLHRNGSFFASVSVTGSHQRSLAWVRDGVADVAAIDCVTWGLLGRHRAQDLRGLRVVGETAPMHAPPYVTRSSASEELVAALQVALDDAVQSLSQEARAALGLEQVVPASREDYRSIAAVARWADALGHREFEAPAVA